MQVSNIKVSLIFLVFCLVFNTETQAAIQYTVSRTQSCTSSCTGNIVLTGWLEVAGTGSVNPSTGITNWSLTFTSTNWTNTLTPSNSAVTVSGTPTITATASQLQISFPTSSSTVWAINNTTAFPEIIGWQFQGTAPSMQEILTNTQNLMGAGDQASGTSGGTVAFPVVGGGGAVSAPILDLKAPSIVFTTEAK